MRLSWLALPIALVGAPAAAETSLELAPAVAEGLERATSAADIAALAAAHPGAAATLMADAAALGVASPAGVVAAFISPSTPCETLGWLIFAAAEAAPHEADATVAAAITALSGSRTGCAAAAIATSAANGLEAAGLSAALLRNELAEIAAVTAAGDPDMLQDVVQALAAATDDETDTAAAILAGGADIETADIPPAAAPARARVPIAFPEMPSAAQNNPSAN